jgi:hypothetical protein
MKILDIMNKITEENEGLRFSRINTFKWTEKNRLALKKHESSWKPKRYDYDNFQTGVMEDEVVILTKR